MVNLKHHIDFINKLVSNGGPEPHEYGEFTNWIAQIHQQLGDGTLSKSDLDTLRSCFGEALSILTLQGFALEKPHGYPGDYEILDKIYLKHTSKNPDLRKWDLYFQLQKAPIAVRNRKHYFIELCKKLAMLEKRSETINVLNIASGPCRDLFEYLSEKNDQRIMFDNVEFDPLAISYAKNICKDYLNRVNFLHTNAFDFTS